MSSSRTLKTPADLQAVMHTDYQVSDQQWAAISAPLEPAVVIAGAGSGKTSVMAARVVYLVVTGQVRPDQVLGLTFTTKAAAELRTRIRSALDRAGFSRGDLTDDGAEEILEPVVATYNAYASALLAEHGLRIGHEPDTRVIADAARYQLAGRVIDRHDTPVRLLSDSPKHVIDYVLALDGSLAEHLVTPVQLRAFDAREAPLFDAELTGAVKADVARAFGRRAEALDLVEEYRSLKAALGLMDFSDQIALAARLAEEHPAVGALEREKFRIVLLDEYQDTSVAQALMLRGLFSGATAAAGRGHPVTAVGDPNQAIYGWRGASVSNILRFGEDFSTAAGSPDVAAYPLTVNRRSDRRVLEAANALARPLLDGFAQVQPLEPGGDGIGSVQVVVHETYADELDWLTTAVQAAHDGSTREVGERWREIGVLTRDNAHAADVFDALTAAEIPVEIVGLKGLLRLPEVGEVLATLTLVSDLTANSELLALLTGPRWAVGPRDLALLGRRAEELAAGRRGRVESATLDEALAAAVAGADPTEVPALSDALEDPGGLSYSTEARERFGLLAAELRMLRAHAGEPLLELVRRIIDVCGIDVELASSVSEATRARRENLDLFVKAVAEFQAVDGAVTLPALLAWLEAEQDGQGLDIATPSEADSVKLLTVHRAKGLEWDQVFLVGACEERFPNTRSRGIWPNRVELLPTPLRGDRRDLPALGGHDKAAIERLRLDTKQHEQTEELRLGYVALTRARHALVVSSFLWTEGRKSPLGPSPYQQTLREVLAGWDNQPLAWRDKPEKGTPNPLQASVREVPWPVTEQTAEALRRLAAAELVRSVDPTTEDPELDTVQAAQVAEWDEELDRLLAEARREVATEVAVPLPPTLSATALGRLREDPAAFAAELVRPMPRRPSPAARFGTRFHAWLEARFGQQDLIDPDELPGRADAGIDDDADLDALIERFEQGPFADRPPHRIEAPFSLVLAGQVIRGRIDAVYREPDGSFLIVDWKTNRAADADPLQLAIYRLAWAELQGVPLDRVRAAFHYVRTQQTIEQADLPDRAALEALVS
ncbi:MAG: ATP-dependent DNA helicase [Nocardioides sp.]|uniref:ATP-dependent helicase n=1 Tax=Nocardioides sp. TaxID=35761 RepID=UPI0039E43AFE